MHRLVLSSSSASSLCLRSSVSIFQFGLSQYDHHLSLKHSSLNRSYSQSCRQSFFPCSNTTPLFSATPSTPSWLKHQRAAHSGSNAAVGGVQSFLLTDVGEGIAEVEIINFYVKVGDKISEFDRVCEVQSDKATVEITSRFEGVVSKVYYQKGDIAKVGKPLIDVTLSAEANADSAPAPEDPTASSQQSTSSHDEQFTQPIRTSSGGIRKVLATPAVRRLASERKLTLSTIEGSGKDGRVTKADIIRSLEPQTTPTKATTTAPVHEPLAHSKPEPSVIAPVTEEDREVPIRGYARAMVKTMTAAAKVPHFGYADELEVDNLITFRKLLLRTANERGVDKLTLMPIFLKALSLSLKAYPIVNSQFKEESMSLVYKGSHNIGVAMDTPSGLVVPNIKNCQSKSVLEIAQEMNRLTGLAKENKLSVNDLTGGTITLSNVGTIGGTYTSPVLNLPEVAIGALGKIQTVPRFDSQGNVRPIQIIQLSWSADHRVLDGATIARFSTLFKRYIENPTSMLLECR